MTKGPKPRLESGAQRLESFQTPFNLRLYGRVIEGVEVKHEHLNGRIRERRTLQALRSKVLSGQGIAAGLAEPASAYWASSGEARLANIYGYARGNERTILPRPLTFLVDHDGQATTDWENQFSKDDGFKYWEVEPQETTYRFDVRLGSFSELLASDAPQEPVVGAVEPDGGTLIRGADNRLYLIPLALEPFEVHDPREVSDLQIQSQYGREVKVDSVRSLTGRSTLVARSTLQVRSTLTLRSTLAAAGRSAGPPMN
jgi:hypothetical protein